MRLYALALDQVVGTLGATEQLNDAAHAAAVVAAMKNLSFEGASGKVSLDANGDRELDVQFLNVLDSDEWPVIAKYSMESRQLSPMAAITWMSGNNVKVSNHAHGHGACMMPCCFSCQPSAFPRTCPKGYSKTNPQADMACEPCPAGKFKYQVQSHNCEECPAGTVSQAGHSNSNWATWQAPTSTRKTTGIAVSALLPRYRR